MRLILLTSCVKVELEREFHVTQLTLPEREREADLRTPKTHDRGVGLIPVDEPTTQQGKHGSKHAARDTVVKPSRLYVYQLILKRGKEQ